VILPLLIVQIREGVAHQFVYKVVEARYRYRSAPAYLRTANGDDPSQGIVAHTDVRPQIFLDDLLIGLRWDDPPEPALVA
jgi:hypothetical protein